MSELIKTTQAKRMSGQNLPFDAKRMFVRRYNQSIKQYDDEQRARRSGMALVRTKYKKVGSRWELKKDVKRGVSK